MLTRLGGVCAALLITLAPNLANAQDKHPAIWTIKDADTTIYLFGVAHALTPDVTWFQGTVKSAFDSSQELVLEVLEPPPEEVKRIVMNSRTSDTRPMIERLSADVRPLYTQRLADFGIPPNAFDSFDPWFAILNLGALSVRRAGYDGNLSGEHVLSAAAREQGKAVVGLETPEQQFSYFKSPPVTEQIAALERSLREPDRTAEVMKSIAKHWLNGESDAVATEMNAELRSPAFRKTLITDRNVRWAKWIEHRMETPGTVFVAVGAGHLDGPENLRAALKKNGIPSTRID